MSFEWEILQNENSQCNYSCSRGHPSFTPNEKRYRSIRPTVFPSYKIRPPLCSPFTNYNGKPLETLMALRIKFARVNNSVVPKIFVKMSRRWKLAFNGRKLLEGKQQRKKYFRRISTTNSTESIWKYIKSILANLRQQIFKNLWYLRFTSTILDYNVRSVKIYANDFSNLHLYNLIAIFFYISLILIAWIYFE